MTPRKRPTRRPTRRPVRKPRANPGKLTKTEKRVLRAILKKH